MGAILPTFCPTEPHRAARTRITLNSQSAESPADQGEGDSAEPCRTAPDEPHPAENRKVGGSIPSLPTVLGQLIEVRPVLPNKGSPKIGVMSWAITLSIAATRTKVRRAAVRGWATQLPGSVEPDA